MPKVAVIFTGGTISMVASAEAGGKVPTLDGAAILARAPGIDAIAELEIVDLGRTPASHFSFAKLFEIGSEFDAARRTRRSMASSWCRART